jgi:tetratricopeptide (TPR) repeat protein
MSKVALATAAFIAIIFSFPSTSLTEPYDATAVKQKAGVSCVPDRMAIAQMIAESNEISILPGSGNYKWKINTRSDSAQAYFNQGINMYYGFHIIEAIASFKKAATFDPSNPMLWWAQALAAGPNINDVGYPESPEAYAAAQKASELSENSSDVEKALIKTMTLRYSSDTAKSRPLMNEAYAAAMKEVYNQFPENVDVMALYADALMLLHPWDLWEVSGKPKAWQPEIQQVLEKVISKDPMHPGGNHYYIHTLEASSNPEKALHSANVLGKITPGLSHMVHMPSHIYLRTGDFDKGIKNNVDAVQQYRQYGTAFSASLGNPFIYYWHNLHMLANCALLAGKYDEAIKSANELFEALDADTATLGSPAPMGSFLHYMYMTPVLVNVKFEKWDEVLNAPKPSDKYVYGNILYHFGRGMAYAARKKFDDAKKEAAAMEALMKDENLTLPMTPFSPVIEGSRVAHDILNGSIAFNNNQLKDAISYYEKAAEREWNMVYTEPRDWLLNPHQYLGNAYLADKNYKKAEEAFRQDLKKNAKNIWAVEGLKKASKSKKKKS